MKLKGFSKYDFYIEDCILICKNSKTNKILKACKRSKKMYYFLYNDEFKLHRLTPQRIMYCIDTMAHPDDIKYRHIRGSETNPYMLPFDRKTRKKYFNR